MYFIFIFSLKNQDISASVNGHFFFFWEISIWDEIICKQFCKEMKMTGDSFELKYIKELSKKLDSKVFYKIQFFWSFFS